MSSSRLLLLAVGLAWFGPGCETPLRQHPDAGGDAGKDGAPTADAVVRPDAGPQDASPRPEGVPYDYCGDPFFKLHIGGQAEEVWGPSLSGNRLAYARGPHTSLQWDAYVLDLDECKEYRLTQGRRVSSIFIHHDKLLWADNFDHSDAPIYHCMDLYGYDLSVWAGEQLTDHPLCEWHPKTNGRYVAYERNTTEDGGSSRENLLWDLQTDTATRFAEPGAQAGYYDIDDLWLAWSGYTLMATSLGKDVFYLDLATGEETHVENSAQYYCYDVRLWGDYLTYVCSEYWMEGAYHLFLRHLPTGQELHLDGGQGRVGLIGRGVMSADIVAWITSKHAPDPGAFAALTDVELYDLQSGEFRRLTTTQSRIFVEDISIPWVVLSLQTTPGEYFYDFYVANLEQLGVLDAAGHLVPGEPVLAPPP